MEFDRFEEDEEDDPSKAERALLAHLRMRASGCALQGHGPQSL